MRAAYSALSAQYISMIESSGPGYDDDTALVERHLTGLPGRVLDLGCGPGHWTARLHAAGVDVTGVDMVPEFIAHARASHPGPPFVLGSMLGLDLPEHSVAGVLSWYSTIHLPPPDLDKALAEFRRLLAPGGTLVVGFFDSADGVAEFDHAVATAYRWPVEVFTEHLAEVGFSAVECQRHEVPERPDRKFAAIAAVAS